MYIFLALTCILPLMHATCPHPNNWEPVPDHEQVYEDIEYVVEGQELKRVIHGTYPIPCCLSIGTPDNSISFGYEGTYLLRRDVDEGGHGSNPFQTYWLFEPYLVWATAADMSGYGGWDGWTFYIIRRGQSPSGNTDRTNFQATCRNPSSSKDPDPSHCTWKSKYGHTLTVTDSCGNWAFEDGSEATDGGDGTEQPGMVLWVCVAVVAAVVLVIGCLVVRKLRQPKVFVNVDELEAHEEPQETQAVKNEVELESQQPPQTAQTAA